jgi:predicted nucleic acid-binding protein
LNRSGAEAKEIIRRKTLQLGNQKQAVQQFKRLVQKSGIVPVSAYYPNFERAKQMIRDPKDAPILAAILSVPHDFFVSGDKDFWVLELPTLVSTRELRQKIKNGL